MRYRRSSPIPRQFSITRILVICDKREFFNISQAWFRKLCRISEGRSFETINRTAIFFHTKARFAVKLALPIQECALEMLFSRRLIIPISAVFLALQASSLGTSSKEKPDLLLSTMRQELQRAQTSLSKLDPAPYFLSYSAHDQHQQIVTATVGSLVNSVNIRHRSADVVVRVGNAALDNSHEQGRASAISSGLLSLDDDQQAIARDLWRLTYQEYRKASRTYLNIKTGKQVHAEEEDTSEDFSQEKPQDHSGYGEISRLPDQPLLEKLAREYSGYFRKYPFIYSSAVLITVQADQLRFVSTENTRVVVPSIVIRMAIEAETRATDGMELIRAETFQARSIENLPAASEISAKVEKISADLKALRDAPVAEPYAGPALLSGRAAAVFFHEVLGHRLEGRHLRGETEADTFTKKVNQPVLPGFLSVTDDPTLRSLNGTDLGGWYEYDEEGMPAQRVDLIKDGLLKDFLMSRMPIKNSDHSNGHGRAEAGRLPTGRQGNLIVSSTRTVKDSELRSKFLEEIKKQGKAYGLYFEDIEGGFTLTQRGVPQAFQVLPILVWRVYADARPDELVRGVDIVGTPLAALNRIVVTGDKSAIFNGMCGAESGFIPVSAIAPPMLFSEIEIQKKSHSLDRPPILPSPFEGADLAESGFSKQ
jgi:predicted Zn-dependent protease